MFERYRQLQQTFPLGQYFTFQYRNCRKWTPFKKLNKTQKPYPLLIFKHGGFLTLSPTYYKRFVCWRHRWSIPVFTHRRLCGLKKSGPGYGKTLWYSKWDTFKVSECFSGFWRFVHPNLKRALWNLRTGILSPMDGSCISKLKHLYR